jgi:hypothetical protein
MAPMPLVRERIIRSVPLQQLPQENLPPEINCAFSQQLHQTQKELRQKTRLPGVKKRSLSSTGPEALHRAIQNTQYAEKLGLTDPKILKEVVESNRSTAQAILAVEALNRAEATQLRSKIELRELWWQQVAKEAMGFGKTAGALLAAIPAGFAWALIGSSLKIGTAVYHQFKKPIDYLVLGTAVGGIFATAITISQPHIALAIAPSLGEFYGLTAATGGFLGMWVYLFKSTRPVSDSSSFYQIEEGKKRKR